MLRPFGMTLASDAITHRYGFDNIESQEVRAMCDRHAALGIRSTFAINTHYPEVRGGYFENRALFGFIDRALRAQSLLPVLWECYCADGGLNPVEGEDQLLVNEQYALIDVHETQRGLLQVWQFHCGGGGTFYGDNVIFDLILPQRLTRDLVDDVERHCAKTGVRFTREASLESL